MTIHFVCRGNTYRSRLAESYLKSKLIGNIKVSSSGIQADRNLSGLITWWAQRIIQNENLQNFESYSWQKTTQELLDKGDYIIFLYTDIYDYSKANFNFNSKKFEVWNVEDLEELGRLDEDVISQSEKSFIEIKKKVEGLIAHLPNLQEKSE